MTPLRRIARLTAALALPAATLPAAAQTRPATPAAATDYRARPPQAEVIYFVLPDRFENGDPANDRGGLAGGAMATGFDPTHKGFYHGGDLKGLTRRLDYIQGLGATAIWLGPIFRNKAVQGTGARASAGYHGYWITDFTAVDPHLGNAADLRALVDAAHARGMKVYMDIIVNHTADVIRYRECGDNECPYRDRAAYPYQRRPDGTPINPGFAGDEVQTAPNFARLTDPAYAYTPYIPDAEKAIKAPAWLNDPLMYHNRGHTSFRNESSETGDFGGLDDLMTENPRVVAGMIDIFGGWIDRFGIDGFRVDTARHVNPAFWRSFVPAMRARAAANGIPNFHIFGEVTTDGVDPGYLAGFARDTGFPALLDFGFQETVKRVVADNAPTSLMERLLSADILYPDGANILPTFTGNHDHGRFARDVREGNPGASDAELLARVRLANAMMLTLRGVPTIYSGDEQGFTGDGNDQDAREDMFASRVASYNDNRLVGTNATTATANFDTRHPLYRQIAELAHIRLSTPALTDGRQVVRARGDGPGLFAVSRFDPLTGREVLLAFNTSAKALTSRVQVGTDAAGFRALAGACPSRVAAPGSLIVALPAFGYAICAAEPR